MINSGKRLHRQQGLSMPTIVVIIAIIGTMVLAFFTVFPMAYENLQVQTSLEALAEDQTIDPRSKRDIYEALNRRFVINDVDSVQRENIKITREDGKTTVVVQYQATNSFIANYFIGANFENQVVINR